MSFFLQVQNYMKNQVTLTTKSLTKPFIYRKLFMNELVIDYSNFINKTKLKHYLQMLLFM